MNKMGIRAWESLAWQAVETPFTFLTGWRARVCPGVPCQMHAHTSLELVYHRKGSGVTRMGAGSTDEVTFVEGSCVIYAPDLPHDQIMNTPGEDLCVHLEVPSGLGKQLKGCLVVPDAVRRVGGDWDRLTSGRKALDALEQRILNLQATTALLTMLHQSISPEGGRHTASKEAVVRAEEYIRENFATIASMQEVAVYAGLSHDRLRHLFRQQRGMSLVSFVTRVKLERAKSLLIHSKLPLKQIATLCGFRDEYYFSNVFKRHVGVPPGGFRQHC